MTQANSPAAPAEAASEACWSYVPQSVAAAQVMANRARRAGRPVPPAAARLLEPAEAAPAPADEAPAALPAAPDPAPPPAGTWLAPAADPGATPAPTAALAALAGGPVFTSALRVRFLDHLAFSGNVRAAAARVAISRETAYRTRRQDPAFAALWDAALVHARHFAEAELATRALDGVEVAVRWRGEVVGHEVRHDPRLLLAHLARLDRRVDSDAAARARAERFDELLAAYAGHGEPADFAAAAGAAAPPDAPDLPPTREAYAAWCRGQMLDALAGADEEEEEEEADGTPGPGEPTPEERERREAVEAEALADAAADGEAEWDAWHDGSHALVAAIAEGAAPAPADGVDEGPPIEVKSAPRNRVTCVRTPPANPRRRWPPAGLR